MNLGDMMGEDVRIELSKKPKTFLVISGMVVVTILIVGFVAQFHLAKRSINIDAERQVLKERQAFADKELAGTKLETESAINILAQYKPEVDNLSQERQKLLGEVSGLINRKRIIEEQIQAQKITLDTALSEEKRSKKDRTKLDGELTTLRGQLNALKEQVGALNGKAAEKRRVLSELTVDATFLQQKTLALAQVNADLKIKSQNLAVIKDELKIWEERVAKQRTQSSRLSATNADIVETLHIAEKRVRRLEAKKTILTVQLSALQVSKAEYDSVGKQLSSAKESLLRAEEKAKFFIQKTGSARTLEDMISTKRYELSKLSEKVFARQADLARLQRVEVDLEYTKKAFKKTKVEKESMEALSLELDKQLTEKRKNIAALEEKIDLMQTVLKQSPN
jgi:chromosome segregation ATPase